MAPQTAFITGCNRGLGLQLVKQLVSLPSPIRHVFATYRSKDRAGELMELSQEHPCIVPIQMDTTDYESYPGVVEQVSEVVGESGLNLVINNAAMMPNQTKLQDVTVEDMAAAYSVNCIAPLVLTRALLPLIKKAVARPQPGRPGYGMGVDRAAVVHMSTVASTFASDSRRNVKGMYAYRCSKAALNMSMKTLATDLQDSEVLVVAMHPGWVRTEAGSQLTEANVALSPWLQTIHQITPETSARTMIQTMSTLTESDHGTFLGFDGTQTEW